MSNRRRPAKTVDNDSSKLPISEDVLPKATSPVEDVSRTSAKSPKSISPTSPKETAKVRSISPMATSGYKKKPVKSPVKATKEEEVEEVEEVEQIVVPLTMSPLVNNTIQSVKWTGNFKYDGLVRIATPMDGSSFFHAVVMAFSVIYKTGTYNGIAIDRKKYIKNLRLDLSKLLSQPVDPRNSDSLTYYDTLYNGKLKRLAKEDSTYELDNLSRIMAGTDSTTSNIIYLVYRELLSSQIDKNIYILDSSIEDVDIEDVGKDDNLYANRDSVVLLKIGNHYELIGVNDGGKIKTLFPYDHNLILTIRARRRMVK